MERSDIELIGAYFGGDEEALEILVSRHLSGVYSFALRLTGDEHEAEDIAQETFLKTWNNLKKFDVEKSSFKTWMMRIARNSAIDHLRKKKHVPLSHFDTEEGNVLLDTTADTAELPEEVFAKLEDNAVLIEALDLLPPLQREVLILYYTNDLTFEEIGQTLEEPANTVKSRHRRALIALRTLLEGQAPK